MLLGAEDTAWPRNPDPPDEIGRGEAEVLHGVDADQRASAPETCLAVDGNRSWLIFAHSQEALDNIVSWR